MTTEIDAILMVTQFEVHEAVLIEARANDVRDVDPPEGRLAGRGISYEWVPVDARHTNAMLETTVTISDTPLPDLGTVEVDADTSTVSCTGSLGSDGYFVECGIGDSTRALVWIREDLHPDWIDDTDPMYVRIEMDYDEKASIRRYGKVRIEGRKRRFEDQLQERF